MEDVFAVVTCRLGASQGERKSQEKGQEQLHPSWAAKKALADRGGLMAQSQGTKVVFGDDD